MAYENLKDAIGQVIKSNGNQEITGSILQSTLFNIVNTIGEGVTFAGIATPTTNPGIPDGQVFYIASEPGNYVNFLNLDTVIKADNKIHIIYNDINSDDWFEEALDLMEFMPILKVLSLIGSAAVSIGVNNVVEGENTAQSLAVGAGNTIGNFNCLVNGNNNKATGGGSHAEGVGCEASNSNSHAEGNLSKASGSFSHAEGYKCISSGANSHAEGDSSEASGSGSHAEGFSCIASNSGSHAEGNLSKANGPFSHAEGFKCIAEGENSHAEGTESKAVGANSHAEGKKSTANGSYSHAEGEGCEADGIGSHAEGSNCVAKGYDSHAEGQNSTAEGRGSHAEGFSSLASGPNSHAGGSNCKAIGDSSHAEGIRCVSKGHNSHAEGNGCEAIGEESHAEGFGCRAVGSQSHAGGSVSRVENTGTSSFAHGTSIIIDTPNTTCFGTYNFFDFSTNIKPTFVIGIGTDRERLNALVILSNGNIFIKGVGGYEGQDILDGMKPIQDIIRV